MSELSRKEDLLELLKKPDFIELLFINSEQEFGEQSQAFQSSHDEYYATDWDEHTSGVDLFTTPRKSIGAGDPWGTWLEVVKLYGNYECQYRVRALEYAPWGQDVESSTVGDYKTLGQAMDVALGIHEHGSVEINVIEEDLDRGCYVRGDSRIEGPEDDEAQSLSDVALAVNKLVINHAALQDAKREAVAREREILRIIDKEACAMPVSLEDAKPILAQFRQLLEARKLTGSTDIMHAAASVINDELFGGKAKLISFKCDFMMNHHDPHGDHGAVFAVLEREEGGYTYVSAGCGIQEGFECAMAASTAHLVALYGKHEVEPGMYWLDDELWEFDFKALSANEEESVPISEPDDMGSYDPTSSYDVHRAMLEAVTPYREALKEKIGPMIREREAKVRVKPSIDLSV
ncbi:hypothetical protein [Pseudomonas amygdali]|nr:hypothetical protein [Pseudomonas amygdali]